MWFLEAGIANLLLIPCLECEGYHVLYDTESVWRVKCPNGGILLFKKDVGACDGFPYVNLDILSNHGD